MNLGSWLNIENFMIGLPGRDWQMRAAAKQLWGTEEADAFFKAWEAQFITEADIAEIARLGFDSIRLPVVYRLLESDDAPGVFNGSTWKAIDRCLAWAEKHGLAVMLDLHGAPGGQNTTHPSGNATGYPLLWQDKTYQDRTVALWEELVRRSRKSQAFFACNLLNEPMVNHQGPQSHAEQAAAMNALNQRLIEAIRRLNVDCWIAIDAPVRSSGGVRWLDTELFADPKTILGYHHYPFAAHESSTNFEQNQSAAEDLAALEKFLWNEIEAERTFAEKIQRPVLLGEFGLPCSWDPVRGPRMVRAQLNVQDRLGWGWLLWSYKDVNHMGLYRPRRNTPWRVFVDDPNWQAKLSQIKSSFGEWFDQNVIAHLDKNDANFRTYDAAWDDCQRGIDRPMLEFRMQQLKQIPLQERCDLLSAFALENCQRQADIWNELAPWLSNKSMQN